MSAPSSSAMRRGLDRAGVLLSSLCAVHCVAGVVVAGLLGLGAAGGLGAALLNPHIHEVGLAMALVIGGLGLGLGVLRHRQPQVLAMGAAGLALMAGGLAAPHGPIEAGLTIAGVSLLALAHIRNLRHAH